MIYIREKMGEVVAALRPGLTWDDSFDPSFRGQLPDFIYGHPLSINHQLVERGKKLKGKYRKYPLIALRMDYDEEVDNGLVKAVLNMAIIHSTSMEYTEQERDAKVFTPILFPLYERFMSELKKHGFNWPGWQGMPKHTKTDRPYYGVTSGQSNVKNLFSDPLDAIEITNLELSLRIKNC